MITVSLRQRSRGLESLRLEKPSNAALCVVVAVSALAVCARLDAAPKKPSAAEAAAAVDRLLDEAWAQRFLKPAPPAAPEALLRRLSVDLRGVIPHADEVERFSSDGSPGKIAAWVEWFLDTPDFAQYQAEIWEHALIGRRGNADGLDRESFRRFLRGAFLENKPYDDLVREILLSEGLPEEQPGVGFFLRYEGRPEDIAGRAARVFLGTRIECAECHDHPYADVKREEFYGFAAFFARTRRYRDEDRAGGDTRRYGVREVAEGEIAMPPMKRGEKPVEIAPLLFGERFTPASYVGGAKATAQPGAKPASKPASKPAKTDKGGAMASGSMNAKGSTVTKGVPAARRKELVAWLTAPKNKYFARALVNRVWAQLLGKGFVNPVDDFSDDSKIALPQVLEYLTADFVDNGYDLRRLYRIIVLTRAYQQQATRGVPGGIVPGEDHDQFTSVPIRPLEAEVLARSVLRATGLEEPQPEENARRVRGYIETAQRDFARRFGIDESERRPEFQGTVLQVLLLFNGEFTSGKAPTSRPFHPVYEKNYPGNLDVVLQGVPPARQVDQLFLATLSRLPTEAERRSFQQHLFATTDDGERQKALADIQWALLNCAEFLHAS